MTNIIQNMIYVKLIEKISNLQNTCKEQQIIVILTVKHYFVFVKCKRPF